MNVLIINPPLVQLNAPYPSGAYLSAFFKEMGCDALWQDLSIELFHKIFSRKGLTKLFSLTEKKALKMAASAQVQGDEATAFNLRRYVSTSGYWIEWIDFITETLCDGRKNLSTREKEHQFLYSPFVPRGNHMDSFLAGLEKEPSVDDVRFLCSYALADLADYITAVFDESFSLIRYAEFVAIDSRSFSEIERQLDTPVMREFYQEVLEEKTRDFFSNKGDRVNFKNKSDRVNCSYLICISVPFAGTYIPALYTARYFKKIYGDSVYIVLGGGYVNTELREINSCELGKYVDALSFDRGYGSYKVILEKIKCNSDLIQTVGTESDLKTKGTESTAEESILKTKVPESIAEKSISSPVYPHESHPLSFYKLLTFRSFVTGEKDFVLPQWKNPEYEKFEAEITARLIPDYSEIDFSKYLRVCDDKNPMHRLWTDGSWIKAYLAHGCYWHKCLFCDTKLDYVCGYKPVDEEKLFYGLLKISEEKKVQGIHFVDEALPPAALKRFALLNKQNGNPLYYWGNVRFEKAFTKDLAALLSCCGLGAVSAGIEVATGEGLKNINKGTDIESIVGACAAFKESGILVHAYMIYGFWYDTSQSIIDSMETLRQFFAQGLLDSAFWHKFMFTKNSHAYEEYCAGGKKIPDLSGYEKFGSGLEAALNAWMHGEKLDMKVTKWFDFPVPNPAVPKNYIEKAIEKYELKNEKIRNSINADSELYWLGTKPLWYGNSLNWIYLQEENEFTKQELGFQKTVELSEILWGLRPEAPEAERMKSVSDIKKYPDLIKLMKKLHGQGLVCIR